MRNILTAFSTAASAILVSPSAAQQSPPNNIATVPSDDADITAAISAARSRLPEFLNLARRPDPSMHTFAVKLAIPTDRGKEFIWVALLQIEDSYLIGRVSNLPENIKGIKQGQRIKFTTDDIMDWTYHRNGRRKGNYTARAIARRMPPAEGQRMLRELNFDPDP
jgi:uncharacterized protein YegJ (DUF2314 family)